MTIGGVIIILCILALASAVWNNRFTGLLNEVLDYAIGLFKLILIIGIILVIANVIMPEVYVELRDVVNPIREFLSSVWNFRIF